MSRPLEIEITDLAKEQFAPLKRGGVSIDRRRRMPSAKNLNAPPRSSQSTQSWARVPGRFLCLACTACT